MEFTVESIPEQYKSQIPSAISVSDINDLNFKLIQMERALNSQVKFSIDVESQTVNVLQFFVD